jgi:peptidoglycan/LPS O-acetylase OafA/YrhL
VRHGADTALPDRGSRPDIQALRALAVAAVLVYHLWPSAVPGGYVGVDVFFVVSGFLITGLLHREVETTGRVRLLAFWARRIRRLLPSAFVVLACTIVLLVFVVPRVAWGGNLEQIRAASAYLLNWQLAYDRMDYLAANSSPTLVQHYWSLAVEEQFYLVWPLLIMLTAGVGVRRLHVGLRPTLLILVGATTLSSFWFALRTTDAYPAFAFFSTQSRAWEFALGAAVALMPSVQWRPRLAWLAYCSGIALILASCLLLSHETSFPGWAAAMPTVGCALALASGERVRRYPRPVIWLGDHSYPVYLWHWPPIIALPWVVHAPLGDLSKCAILVATLAFAWLTKKYVEDPVRSGPAWQARRWASLSLATAGAAALVLTTTVVWAAYDSENERVAVAALAQVQQTAPCFGAAAIMEHGCTDRFAKPSSSVIAFAPTDVGPARSECQPSSSSEAKPRICWFGDLASPRSTIAIVGNSYAVRLVPLVREWTLGKHVRILLAARTDCLGLSTFPVPGQDSSDPCLGWSSQVQDRLLHVQNLSLVVFTGHPDSLKYLTGQAEPSHAALGQARRNVLDSFRLLASHGVPIAVVKPAPGTRPLHAPECVARSQASNDPCSLPRAQVTAMDFLSELARAHRKLTGFVSMDRYFCTADRCHAVVGGLVAYSDDHHISASFARTLAPYVGPALERASRRSVTQPHIRP